MREQDVEPAYEVAAAAFEDLSLREGRTPGPRPPAHAGLVRIRRLLDSDPGGCWVLEGTDGTLDGVAMALMREGLWGLSQLVVRPGTQSRGIGSALLDRALAYGDGARGGIILASSDPRALHVYARAGFTLHPTSSATGRPRGVTAAPEVRPFVPADHAMAARVDRALRGAAHGADLDALVEAGCELLAFPDRGYAVRRGGEVRIVAAADEEAAGALLRTSLARVPDGEDAEIAWLTPAQQWAIDVALQAGLEVRPYGGLFLRGETGAFRPYLPSGIYL
jgi:GNAT superfamily N-acetyltransferase